MSCVEKKRQNKRMLKYSITKHISDIIIDTHNAVKHCLLLKLQFYVFCLYLEAKKKGKKLDSNCLRKHC